MNFNQGWRDLLDEQARREERRDRAEWRSLAVRLVIGTWIVVCVLVFAGWILYGWPA
jgi:hypothetical protein